MCSPTHFLLPDWHWLCITSCNYVIIGLLIFLIPDFWVFYPVSSINTDFFINRLCFVHHTMSAQCLVCSSYFYLWNFWIRRHLKRELRVRLIYSRLDSNLVAILGLDLIFPIFSLRILCEAFTACHIPIIQLGLYGLAAEVLNSSSFLLFIFGCPLVLSWCGL